MSRRQILSGFGGKHHAPTRARKSPPEHTPLGDSWCYVRVPRDLWPRGRGPRTNVRRSTGPRSSCKNFRARDRDRAPTPTIENPRTRSRYTLELFLKHGCRGEWLNASWHEVSIWWFEAVRLQLQGTLCGQFWLLRMVVEKNVDEIKTKYLPSLVSNIDCLEWRNKSCS